MAKTKEKRIFHDWSLSRMKYLWFWKGQLLCRLFGHRVPKDISRPKCGRCGIALEEIYGLAFYFYYSVIPYNSENSDIAKLKAAAKKLAQCFPPVVERGKLFDIPRYIIDELEQALTEG